jgi:hypothetical protein
MSSHWANEQAKQHVGQLHVEARGGQLVRAARVEGTDGAATHKPRTRVARWLSVPAIRRALRTMP